MSGVDQFGGWTKEGGEHSHAPTCPRSNLPDLVTPQRNAEIRDQRRLPMPPMNGDEFIRDTSSRLAGILVYGKTWRRRERDRPKKIVRFSGKNEYTLLDNVTPEDEHAVLSRLISPKLRELGMLLGKDPWQLDLGHSSALEDHQYSYMDIPDPPPEPKSLPNDPSRMGDDHIGESMRRYEEMRRMLSTGEIREENSDESKSSNDSYSSDHVLTESRIRRIENADMAQVAGRVMRSNSEVRRAIEENAWRRSMIRIPGVKKRETGRYETNSSKESSVLEKLKWLTASEDLTNGNNDTNIDNEYQNTNQINSEMHRHEQSSSMSNTYNNKEQYSSTSMYRDKSGDFNRTTSSNIKPYFRLENEWSEWNVDSPHFFTHIDKSSLEQFNSLPPNSFQDLNSEDDKLLYSGGVRYTREGILMPPRKKELAVNKILSEGRYSFDDTDDLPTSVTSLNTNNSSSCNLGDKCNNDHFECGNKIYINDELADFVKQDESRMEKIRMKYADNDDQDHGFAERPAVKSLKPKLVNVSSSSFTNSSIVNINKLSLPLQSSKPTNKHEHSSNKINMVNHSSHQRFPTSSHNRTVHSHLSDDYLSQCSQQVESEGCDTSHTCVQHQFHTAVPCNVVTDNVNNSFEARNERIDTASHGKLQFPHNSSNATHTYLEHGNHSQNDEPHVHHSSCTNWSPLSLGDNFMIRSNQSIQCSCGQHHDIYNVSQQSLQPLSTGNHQHYFTTRPMISKSLSSPIDHNKEFPSNDNDRQCITKNNFGSLKSPLTLSYHNHSNFIPASCYPQMSTELHSVEQHAADYNPLMKEFYTENIVPASYQLDMHAECNVASHLNKINFMNDERGVPEGASSSPRNSYDPHYSSPPATEKDTLRRSHSLHISS